MISCGLNAGELFDNRFMRVPKEATSISEPVSLLIKDLGVRIRGNGRSVRFVCKRHVFGIYSTFGQKEYNQVSVTFVSC